MSITARITAAAAAIAAHTDALGIDDANDPAGIGAWHLLYSLYAYCEKDGLFPLDVIENGRDHREIGKPFLVMVNRDGRVNPGAPTAWEYEVRADSLEEACVKAAAMPVRRLDAERRIRHEAYTDRYIAPNWDGYAGGAIIEEGKPDAKKGVALAIAMEWMPAPPRIEMGWVSLLDTDDNSKRGDPIASAAFALDVYKRFVREEGEDRIRDVENLLRGVKEYLTRFGEDFEEMLRDVKSERPSIEGTGTDMQENEIAGLKR